MTAQAGSTDDREVIPRWRTFKNTAPTSELASLRTPIASDVEPELAALRKAFEDKPLLYTAADLLSSLLANGRSDSETARLSAFIRGLSDVPAVLASLLDEITEDESDGKIEDRLDGPNPSSGDAARRVRLLRKVLTLEPRNAVRWVDLALAHATLGMVARASREMLTALSLAPESRFVLRSATRFYVHLNDPEQANAVLGRSQRLRSDPWLLAAELSTSQLAFGRFKNERAARELLLSQNLSPHSLSELASELATNEIRGGRDSRARKLFEIALNQPTENSVAQAASLANESDLHIDPALFSIERGFEARAISHSQSGEWRAAAEEGRDWQLDQPFALEPALFTSYAASVGAADFELALSVVLDGLVTHPHDPMLHNNAAFALANLDRSREARTHLAFARDTGDDVDSCIHRATLGLVMFREGDVLGGRKKYISAIESLAETKKERAAVATVFWALEEKRKGTEMAGRSKELALDAVRKHPSPEGTAVVERLTKMDGIDLRTFPVSPS